MLKDPECAMRYEQSMAAMDAMLPAKRNIEAVRELQAQLKKLPQVDSVFDTINYFSPGIYTRESRIPADTFVIGKTHRHSHPTFMLSGTCKMWDVGAGTEPEIMEAPRLWISVQGAKRVLYTMTDCVFVTCHASEETDLDKLEEQLIIPEADFLEELP